jgi:hypothetical protein
MEYDPAMYGTILHGGIEFEIRFGNTARNLVGALLRCVEQQSVCCGSRKGAKA